jgi:hypothetical protein
MPSAADGSWLSPTEADAEWWSPISMDGHIHGWTAERVEVLLCYQREGDSKSGFRTSWRTLHVEQIEEPQLLDVPFAFDQPDYDASAREVRFVHCRIEG